MLTFTDIEARIDEIAEAVSDPSCQRQASIEGLTPVLDVEVERPSRQAGHQTSWANDNCTVSDPEGQTPNCPIAAASELLALRETVLERWIIARGEVPTTDKKEGFRLLALHRQGAKGDPSFNACRETCRELVYHYNIVVLEPDHPDVLKRVQLAALVAKHLSLFVGGKMEIAGLGEFCCAAKPVRANDVTVP